VSDTVTVRGDWGAGSHEIGVQFLNDAYGGSESADRNLYVDGVTFQDDAAPEAVTVSSGTTALLGEWTETFSFNIGQVTPPPPANLTIGTGPDTIVLQLSQDAYQGPAQYNVSVNGVQINSTVLTAVASRADGVSDTLIVRGDWDPGSHILEVDFLNDAYDGSPETDRNLYVDGITYQDDAAAFPVTVLGETVGLLASGPVTFSFTDAGVAPMAAAESDFLFQ
jgi:hypothetical protein